MSNGIIVASSNGSVGIEAAIDGQMLFAVEDADRPLEGGGVALVVEQGRIMCDAVTVASADSRNL